MLSTASSLASNLQIPNSTRSKNDHHIEPCHSIPLEWYLSSVNTHFISFFCPIKTSDTWQICSLLTPWLVIWIAKWWQVYFCWASVWEAPLVGIPASLSSLQVNYQHHHDDQEHHHHHQDHYHYHHQQHDDHYHHHHQRHHSEEIFASPNFAYPAQDLLLGIDMGLCTMICTPKSCRTCTGRYHVCFILLTKLLWIWSRIHHNIQITQHLSSIYINSILLQLYIEMPDSDNLKPIIFIYV